jgi:hypothetical protein
MLSVPKKIPTRARNIYKVTKTVFFFVRVEKGHKTHRPRTACSLALFGVMFLQLIGRNWQKVKRAKFGAKI